VPPRLTPFNCFSTIAIIIPSHLHAISISSGSSGSFDWVDSGQSMNLRHAHPDFPGASCGTMWTQSPRDILVDTVIPLFSAPMIGACCLGLFLTFSGVPVGSATMQAPALAVPREEGNEKQGGCENESNVPAWNFANRHVIPSTGSLPLSFPHS